MPELGHTNRVELNGLAELRRLLQRLPDELRADAFEIVKEETEGAAVEIAAGYPVRAYGSRRNRGTLRARVITEYPHSKLAIGIVRSQAPHADLYEFGTQVRRTAKGVNRGASPPHPTTVPIARRRRERMTRRLVEMVKAKGFEVSGA